MKGYYNRPDLTQQVIDAAGWLHTGDIAMADNDGFFYIRGRKKNLIVLGSGKKVQPEEVEAVLSHSALLKDVCVLGRTSTKKVSRGHEEVCAVAVPSDLLKNRCSDDRDPLAEEISNEVTRLARQLAPYKRPTRVHVYSGDLPKTATLKVKRALLHQWLDTEEKVSNE
jgi:long-chain acyl-CoA synthetase